MFPDSEEIEIAADLANDNLREDCYPTCPTQTDPNAVCDCPEETQRIREDFRMARAEYINDSTRNY